MSASNRIGAKTDRCQKVGAKNFRPETSRHQNIDAKTFVQKRPSPTLMISEQIRGTKLVTEKQLTEDIKL